MSEALPLAVQLYSVREALAHDQPATLQRLAAMGLGTVETFRTGLGAPDEARDDARALRRDLDAAGLVARWGHGPAPLGHIAEQVMDAAAELGLTTLVVPSPGAVPGHSHDSFAGRDRTMRLGEQVAMAAVSAAGRGLRLAYHNHWQEFGTLPDGGTAYDVLVEAMGPDVLVQLDVYWAQTGGQDPAALVSRLGNRVRSLHLKDGPALPGVDQVALGSGVVDNTGAVRAAAAAEWLVLELDHCAGDVFETVGSSLAWIRSSGLAMSGADHG